MEIDRLEVAIVGGGPAGSTSGYELAKAGVDVAIFDHSHPREKPCGGALPRRFFNDFCIPKGVSKRIIDCIIVENEDGHRVHLFQKFGGATIMRRQFDYALLRKARNIGALHYDEQVTKLLKDGNFWIVETKKKKYKTKLLIGADGCPSIVRRYVIGDIPKQHLAHAVGYHIPHSAKYLDSEFGNAIELYFLGKPYVEGGYIWIFPKINYITVGLGKALGPSSIKHSLDKFINTYPSAKRILFPEKAMPHSHLLPFIDSPDFFNLPTTGHNWILIGDAAGHVNPITGEGIYYAMMGAKLAAEAFLEGDIFKFEKYWRNKYGGDLYWGARLKKIFFNPNVIHYAIEMSKYSEEIKEILADIIASRVKYDDLVLKKIPKLLPKIFIQQLISIPKVLFQKSK